jgi:hypothetical protein
MEYWVSKTDDGLILISVSCTHHKIRHHSARPIIPAFHYSMIEAKLRSQKFHIFSVSFRNFEAFNLCSTASAAAASRPLAVGLVRLRSTAAGIACAGQPELRCAG